ncbi:MAG: NAD-dependent epimerase/dehydratase family protein [Bacteroidetes bacterium]|nr:MAG: NAD-dependent epimerase/dehydratase family protein [Bacteroidota bacterium]
MSNNKTIIVTGSSGLIGSEVVTYYCQLGWTVYGFDNNMRADFFGPGGDTRWNQHRLASTYPNFQHIELDIRDRKHVAQALQSIVPHAIVHTAAQPSHDLAASRAFDDFDVNAMGTLNLLEATRHHCPEAIFVHLSTNKVYGDAPNYLKLVEQESRWDYADEAYQHGISEDFGIDQCKHSIFGASKVAADIMVQEYGRYFNMHTCCLRGGCLTGPNHSGVQLHGFLSYLIRCNLESRKYTIFGYKGKQVRDNIHSLDVVRFIDEFIKAPRIAEVYNIGGGRENSISILEAFKLAESISGKKMVYDYDENNRIGDHICYISDLRKMKAHYPNWRITKNLQTTFEEICESWERRAKEKANI